MKSDELLKLFHSLMKRKNQRKLSGAWELKAIKKKQNGQRVYRQSDLKKIRQALFEVSAK